MPALNQSADKIAECLDVFAHHSGDREAAKIWSALAGAIREGASLECVHKVTELFPDLVVGDKGRFDESSEAFSEVRNMISIAGMTVLPSEAEEAAIAAAQNARYEAVDFDELLSRQAALVAKVISRAGEEGRIGSGSDLLTTQRIALEAGAVPEDVINIGLEVLGELKNNLR